MFDDSETNFDHLEDKNLNKPNKEEIESLLKELLDEVQLPKELQREEYIIELMHILIEFHGKSINSSVILANELKTIDMRLSVIERLVYNYSNDDEKITRN